MCVCIYRLYKFDFLENSLYLQEMFKNVNFDRTDFMYRFKSLKPGFNFF